MELLKSTRTSSSVSLELVGIHAACSKAFCDNLVSELRIPAKSGWLSLPLGARLDLAMEEAKRGFLLEASRFLDWQDFERFAERCLGELSYETVKNVRVKGEGRSWQIDVIGMKEQIVLCLDCKHWAPPLLPSRFKNAETHQSKATRLFAAKLAEERGHSITSLPMILTLFEPPQQVAGGVLIVSVQKLPSLLNELTPFSPNLPFIDSEVSSRKPYQPNP